MAKYTREELARLDAENRQRAQAERSAKQQENARRAEAEVDRLAKQALDDFNKRNNQ